jgi:hypothetical protein
MRFTIAVLVTLCDAIFRSIGHAITRVTATPIVARTHGHKKLW